ncbi:small hydrophobic protein [Sunguru virus]|uniref:Small hydrophobic protein n=1 Tax=Sunguru virus TaxID=1491491 RepID=A0A023T456_9RHAB|nr:small hydrophobic protein [Sunguru virus]AHX81842.1 small hydrophobic protein [Sunguru virus]
MILLVVLILFFGMLYKRLSFLMMAYLLGYYNVFGSVITYGSFFIWYLFYYLPSKWMGAGFAAIVESYNKEYAEWVSIE